MSCCMGRIYSLTVIASFLILKLCARRDASENTTFEVYYAEPREDSKQDAFFTSIRTWFIIYFWNFFQSPMVSYKQASEIWLACIPTTPLTLWLWKWITLGLREASLILRRVEVDRLCLEALFMTIRLVIEWSIENVDHFTCDMIYFANIIEMKPLELANVVSVKMLYWCFTTDWTCH